LEFSEHLNGSITEINLTFTVLGFEGGKLNIFAILFSGKLAFYFDDPIVSIQI
jgi:hypothetical protein